MIGAFIMLICTSLVSYNIVSKIKKKHITWIRWIKIRRIFILFMLMVAVPATVYELHVGILDNIIHALYINGLEVFCFIIGLYLSNVLVGIRGWQFLNINTKAYDKQIVLYEKTK